MPNENRVYFCGVTTELACSSCRQRVNFRSGMCILFFICLATIAICYSNSERVNMYAATVLIPITTCQMLGYSSSDQIFTSQTFYLSPCGRLWFSVSFCAGRCRESEPRTSPRKSETTSQGVKGRSGNWSLWLIGVGRTAIVGCCLWSGWTKMSRLLTMRYRLFKCTNIPTSTACLTAPGWRFLTGKHGVESDIDRVSPELWSEGSPFPVRNGSASSLDFS